MNRLKLYLLALTALAVCSAKADEGMWLLQLMQQQHSIDMMKKQGLKNRLPQIEISLSAERKIIRLRKIGKMG